MLLEPEIPSSGFAVPLMFPLRAAIALIAFGSIRCAVDNDEVKTLPGWDSRLPSKHYSGYLKVERADSSSRMLHYYLQEADTDATKKPLLLWLNGGPGASSLIGAFTELGQLIFNKNSKYLNGIPTLFRNPYSWTTVANVLYLEAPAGVGYSYCGDKDDKPV